MCILLYYVFARLLIEKKTFLLAIGFSPFELLYGKTLRGPVQILKELWTEETEIKTSYQYVSELRERLDNTMKNAQEELLNSRKKNKTLYDRRAKKREF